MSRRRFRPSSFSGASRATSFAERPKRVRRADGVAVDVMTITTPDNKDRVVAANNVEIIA